MSIKADIQTKINTIDDTGVNTAAEVRDVLATHLDSILEAGYGAVKEEDSAAAHPVTNPHNASIDYTCHIQKTFRSVTINGTFINNTINFLREPEIFTIDLAEYLQAAGTYYGGATLVFGQSAAFRMSLTGNILTYNGTAPANTLFSFQLTYNTIA